MSGLIDRAARKDTKSSTKVSAIWPLTFTLQSNRCSNKSNYHRPLTIGLKRSKVAGFRKTTLVTRNLPFSSHTHCQPPDDDQVYPAPEVDHYQSASTSTGFKFLRRSLVSSPRPLLFLQPCDGDRKRPRSRTHPAI